MISVKIWTFSRQNGRTKVRTLVSQYRMSFLT